MKNVETYGPELEIGEDMGNVKSSIFKINGNYYYVYEEIFGTEMGIIGIEEKAIELGKQLLKKTLEEKHMMYEFQEISEEEHGYLLGKIGDDDMWIQISKSFDESTGRIVGKMVDFHNSDKKFASITKYLCAEKKE